MSSPVLARPSVAVFAGSSTPSDPLIMEAAALVGRKLAEAGYDIVYGGGDMGVMGAVAKAAQAAGAGITAVTLEKYAHEKQLPDVNLVVVKDERARFDALTTQGNPVALIALPGGPGALREVLQGVEKAVYEEGPPVVLAKVGNYLDGILQYFNQAVSAGMIKSSKAGKILAWSLEDDIATILDPLRLPLAQSAKPSL